MKTFNQFIIEGRDAPLFHGTFSVSLLHILHTGVIKAQTIHSAKKLLRPNTDDDLVGVSLTRDVGFAAAYGGFYVIMQLDQTKLTRRYKISPIQYWQTRDFKKGGAISNAARDSNQPGNYFVSSNEYEEFVITNKDIPIEPYVTHIYITPESIRGLRMHMHKFTNIKRVLGATDAEVIAALQELTTIPITLVSKFVNISHQKEYPSW